MRSPRDRSCAPSLRASLHGGNPRGGAVTATLLALACCLTCCAQTWTVLTATDVATGDRLSLESGKDTLSVHAGTSSDNISLARCVAVMQRIPRHQRGFSDTSSRTYIQAMSGETLLADSIRFRDSSAQVEHLRWGFLDFQPGTIRRIHLGSSPFANAIPPGFAGIRFVNGDALEGKILSISGRTLLIESPDLGKIPIDGLDALSDIVFAAGDTESATPNTASPANRIKLWLRTDEVLDCELVSISRDVWTVRTSHAEEPVTVGSFQVKAACFTGRVVFLSDFEPREVEQTPFFDRVHPWRADLAVTGGTLSTDGLTAFRGLAMHTRTVWTLALPPLLRTAGARFCALAGIDDDAWRATGDAELSLLLDGEVRQQHRLVPGGEPAGVFAELPPDAREIALRADFGKGGSSGDYVDVLWGAVWLPEPPVTEGTP